MPLRWITVHNIYNLLDWTRTKGFCLLGKVQHDHSGYESEVQLDSSDLVEERLRRRICRTYSIPSMLGLGWLGRRLRNRLVFLGCPVPPFLSQIISARLLSSYLSHKDFRDIKNFSLRPRLRSPQIWAIHTKEIGPWTLIGRFLKFYTSVGPDSFSIVLVFSLCKFRLP